MSHKQGRPRPQVRTREEMPRAVRTKEGAQILCPFCTPTHPLAIGEPSPCGTQLKVTAVQSILPSRIVRLRKLICVKCKQGGGEMVQYINGYIHLNDCAPEVNLLRTPPKYNAIAGIVYNLPKKLRSQVVKLTGVPQQVQEITPDGTETGKVAGYFFLKRKAASNGGLGQTPGPATN